MTTAASHSASMTMTSKTLANLSDEAEKLRQVALIHDVHDLRERGYSVRRSADVLGVSKSVVGRALLIEPERMPPRLSQAVRTAAEVFLRTSSPLAGVPSARADSGPSDVVVFDIMREALTNVRADYIALQRRASNDETPGLIEQEIALVREVDAVDARDREAQVAMTRKLQQRHARLRERINAA